MSTKPLPIELRQRVVDAYKAKEGSLEEVAMRFKVSPSSLQRWLRLDRAGKTLKPLPRKGGGGKNQKLFAQHFLAIERWIEAEPDLYLYELSDKLRQEFDVDVSCPHLCRVLKRMKLNRKKKRSRTPISNSPTSKANASPGKRCLTS